MNKTLSLIVAAVALASCTTTGEKSMDPKAFCYSNGTAYSEGSKLNGKSCVRDNAAIVPGTTNNLIWR